MTEYLWTDTDDAIWVKGLKDVVTDTYDNGATITANVYDADGTAVTGATNISVAYIASSDGDYVGEVPDTVTLTVGARYRVKLTIAGTTYTTTIWLDRIATEKRA